MRHYAYQARDSVTGDMHYWLSTSPTGGGYPGPNAATELVKLADNGDVDPDSGIASTSAGAQTSPYSMDIPAAIIPRKSGIYHLIWDVQMVVAVAAATVAVQPRIGGSDVPSFFRAVTIPSGSSVPVNLIHRATVAEGASIGLKLTWSGSATVTPSWRCVYQEQ